MCAASMLAAFKIHSHYENIFPFTMATGGRIKMLSMNTSLRVEGIKCGENEKLKT